MKNFITILLVSFWSVLVAGLTTTSNGSGGVVVNTDGDDKFTVTINSVGSITSILYRGGQYQSSSPSGVSSGLPSGTSVKYTNDGSTAVVTVVAPDGLTHYYIFRNGASAIWMGTYTTSEPSVGELRYAARLANLPNAYKTGTASQTKGGTAIEGSDVFLVNGQTRSKYYSSQRFIDDDAYCAYDAAGSVHACFLSATRSREKSSGGPFFRDIDLNLNDDYHTVTYYMNSNHAQTESYRQGFHGPYILSFSGSSVPSYSNYDPAFMNNLQLAGWVGDSGRGYVSGSVSGINLSKFQGVMHWFNSGYQSWATVSSSGTYQSPALVAGTYTAVLYQGELEAARSSVIVKAGSTVSSSLSATRDIIVQKRTTIWQIGDYDGTPKGFRNADLQLRMHPSDSRMASWTSTSFAVGTSVSNFPMAIFKSVNNNLSITFTLSSSQIKSAVTARIATTLAFAGARPQMTLNSAACAVPAIPVDINSRGVTRGAYHGNMEVYTCQFAASALIAGTNTLKITIASGSSGDTFLSPNIVLDAIELYSQ